MTDLMNNYKSPGWAAFAGILAGMIGAFNLFYGLILVFNAEWVVLSEEGLLFMDVTAWAWLLVVFGVVQLFAAYGIFTVKTWGRAVGSAWAVLVALGQMAFVGATPIWSILVIAMCVMVIYALTAAGSS